MVLESSDSVDFHNLGVRVLQQCVMVIVSDDAGVREQ
jgi:hypothetical protein